jgi:hypothetical protein
MHLPLIETRCRQLRKSLDSIIPAGRLCSIEWWECETYCYQVHG